MGPDFDHFREVILRRTAGGRVPLFEFGVHVNHMDAARQHFGGLEPLGKEGWADPERRRRGILEFWTVAGYDYVRPALGFGFTRQRSAILGKDAFDDSDREWANEADGDILDWASLEAYPWPRADQLDFTELDWFAAHRPAGAGLVLAGGGGPFEWATQLMGLTHYCMALYQEAALVRELHRRVDEVITGALAAALARQRIDAFILGDDMGFRTSTLVPPDALRELVLPCHRRLAAMVHAQGGLYLLHCCGQIGAVMDDLIDSVKIDAKHSYEDAITPVWEAKRRWGGRVGILGGVDMDVMARAEEPVCRARVRDVLAQCSPGGGYALGTGNTVANYVRRENYLALIEEGRSWGR